MSVTREQPALFGLGEAVFSDDGRHRYVLTRRWDRDLPCMTWIGLNPSVAGRDRNDHTISRMCFFAVREGCGGVCVLNLHALVSTDPRGLAAVPLADAIGPENDKHLAGLTPDGPVVACWGAHPFAAARAARVLEILGGVPLWCLGTTKDGWPRHPARLGNDTPLVPFTPRPAPPEIQ